MSIPIYRSEQDIADKVRSNASIAYTVGIQKWEPTESATTIIDKAISALFSQSGLKTVGSKLDKDLYFSKSLFVTTNWNKNDDVFDRIEVWNARHTPSHKPTNLEHNEKLIVGHMTDVWAVNSDYNLIQDESFIDDLPSIYHLINGSVIYRAWSDIELARRAEKLIEEIEAGTKYVSMEALFSDFSYAVITPEKEFMVVARNEDTSFLTKHLRAYGGTGEFDKCKVGRILRNITFSGKGYTNTPANPFSIVLSDDNRFDFTKSSLKNPFSNKSGVFISLSSDISNTESDLMSDNNTFVETKNKELEQTVAQLNKQIDDLKKSQSEASLQALQTKAEDLQAKLDTANSELSSVKATVETLTSEKTELTNKLSEVNTVKADLEQKIAKVEAEKVTANRVSKLVSGGISKEVAEQKVAKFSNLSDEQFEVIAEDVIAAANAAMSDEEKKKKAKEKADAEAAAAAAKNDPEHDANANVADPSLVDTATPDQQAALAAAAQAANEVEESRKALHKFIAARLGNKVDDDTNQ